MKILEKIKKALEKLSIAWLVGIGISFIYTVLGALGVVPYGYIDAATATNLSINTIIGGGIAIPLLKVATEILQYVIHNGAVAEQGKLLAEIYSKEDLLRTYESSRQRLKLLAQRDLNLRIMREIAQKSWSHEDAILFDEETLFNYGFCDMAAIEEILEEFKARFPESKFAATPVYAFCRNDNAYKAIKKSDKEAYFKLQDEMAYLEYAISLKGTALPEIDTIPNTGAQYELMSTNTDDTNGTGLLMRLQ